MTDDGFTGASGLTRGALGKSSPGLSLMSRALATTSLASLHLPQPETRPGASLLLVSLLLSLQQQRLGPTRQAGEGHSRQGNAVNKTEGWDQLGAIPRTVWDQVPFAGALGIHVMGEAGTRPQRALNARLRSLLWPGSVWESPDVRGWDQPRSCNWGWTRGSGGGPVTGRVASRTRRVSRGCNAAPSTQFRTAWCRPLINE